MAGVNGSSKRPHSASGGGDGDDEEDDDDGSRRPAKRRQTVHHGLRQRQALPADISQLSHAADVVQMQLVRAACIVLSAAGFAAVEPSALEGLRAATEECT